LANFANAGVPDLGPKSNRGPSDFDIRHAFSAATTYEVPALKLNSFTTAISQGWSLENAVFVRSALPVNVEDGPINPFFGKFVLAVRPDVVPGEPLYLHGSEFPGGRAFNPAAFAPPPTDPNTGSPIRQGDVPRNFLRGFGATQWDFAVHRQFPLQERVNLEFRAEMFNLLNHPNFGSPVALFGLPGFGIANQMLGQSLTGNLGAGSGGLTPLYQIGGPRSIQFALKLLF
jgi:hypothetical protein